MTHALLGPGGLHHRSRGWTLPVLLLALLAIAGCGGGGGDIGGMDETATALTCDPGNPATAAACGTLLIGITDADGDFLSYTVDVESLDLELANGRRVSTLPNRTRVDFTQYVNLTEFLSAATVPPGNYVAGHITLDYSNAEVFVEADGAAKRAIVVDDDGNEISRLALRIVLDERNRLVVTRGRPSLLMIDFDLAASHVVDHLSTPAIATAQPFIVAEIDPVERKELRVRGPLVSVDEAGMSYTVAIRPFYDRASDFGRVEVHVKDDTEFEIDDALFAGSEGLRALAALGPGTPTVAQGTLNVAQRLFSADIVLAGSSVPGSDADAVRGSVIARRGNELLVRGATIIRRDADAFFRDDVTVTIGPDTSVFKRGGDTRLDIGDISIGQAVTVRGTAVADDANGLHLDATAGAVRLRLTHLSGIALSVNPGQLDVELHTLDRRRAAIFDFSGSGQSPAQDADPENYEIATDGLSVDPQAVGQPIVAFGYPNAFGMAPPDFAGRTIVDFSEVRSLLGIGWSANGTLAPFLSLGDEGLVLDNQNPDIGERHFIKQGPLLIDLTGLPSGTRVQPPANGRGLYAIKVGDSARLFTDFAEFSKALAEALNGATPARALYARGHYAAADNTFNARKLAVVLLQQP